VLELSARCVSGTQQAWQLGIATTTVSRLLSSVTTKLGLVEPLEAIRLAGGMQRAGPGLELVQRGRSNEPLRTRWLRY
jgi:hypothetical protein